MPKLNKVRIINARFNNSKGIYQDFRMPLYGRNATYELNNGGGKSVLLMLILQCVLPNTALDPKRPFKDMFIGGDQNRTTHVLAEWELDEGLFEKKYLLTGFCAKRRSDSEDEEIKDGIRYFSYIHLYNSQNDFDIESIPLCKEEKGEFIVRDYTATQRILREKINAGSEIWIAGTRHEYQERIKRYYLLESEWKFISKINRQENFFKTYFGKYRTSRSLVENLLIRTIDNCLHDMQALRSGEDREESNSRLLAEALYNSQEDLIRLQKEQRCLQDYERLLEEINSLQKTNDNLISSYQSFEGSRQRAASQYLSYKSYIQRKGAEIRELQEKLASREANLRTIQHEIELNRLVKLNISVNLRKQRLDLAGADKTRLEELVEKQKHKVDFARAVNKYLESRKLTAGIREKEGIIRDTELENQDIFRRMEILGKTLFTHFDQERVDYTDKLQKGRQRADELKAINNRHEQDLGKIIAQIQVNEQKVTRFKEQIAGLKQQERELREEHERCPRVDSGLFISNIIEATQKQIEAGREVCTRTSEDIDAINIRLSTNKTLAEELKKQITSSERDISRLMREIEKHTADEEEALHVAGAYGMEGIEACATHLRDKITLLQGSLIELKNNHRSLLSDLDVADKYGITLSSEYLNALCVLQENYPNVMSGAEFLRDLPDGIKEENLNNAPWLTKAILLQQGDYESILRNPGSLPASIKDASVIITSFKSLREKRELSSGDVFIPSRTPGHSLAALNSELTAKRLMKEISATEAEISSTEEMLKAAETDRKITEEFSIRYPEGYREERDAELQELMHQRDEHITRHAAVKKQITDDSISLPDLQRDLKMRQEENIRFERKLELLTEILANSESQRRVQEDLKQELRSGEEYAAAKQQTGAQIMQASLELRETESSNEQNRDYLRTLREECGEYEKYSTAEVRPIQDYDTEELRADYRAAKQVRDRVTGDLSRIEEEIVQNKKTVQMLLDDISQSLITLPEIRASDPHEPISEENIRRLNQEAQNLVLQHKEADEKYRAAEKEHRIKLIDLEKAESEYNSHNPESYVRNADLRDPAQTERDLHRLNDESSAVRDDISTLKDACLDGQKEMAFLVENHNGYEMIESNYYFSGVKVALAEVLIPYKNLQKELSSGADRVKKSKKQFEKVKDQIIRNITGISVAHTFSDVIKDKLRVAEALSEAEYTQQSLNSYVAKVNERINYTQKQMEGLLKVESQIIGQALDIAISYREYLRKFPGISRIEIDGKPLEMLSINFSKCVYSDEVAQGEMHRYIQDLIHHIQAGKLGREELEKALMPDQLLGRVMDMGIIKVSIRKIDEYSHPLQQWEKIKASDGQENTMYIILLVVLMSAIREIVVGRQDKNTAKVLIVDNPFGSTGAYYLWDKIWSILMRNNVQIICSGHNISPNIKEFFPVNCLLSQEVLKSGRVRIGIKIMGAGKELDRLERQKRGNILAWNTEG